MKWDRAGRRTDRPESPGTPSGRDASTYAWPSQQRSARPQPGSRRRVLVLAVVVGVLALLVGGGWLVRYSPVLDAQTVVVQRPTKGLLSEKQVLAAAGVTLGRPVAEVDLDAVAGRVARLPEVAEVTVAQQFPHTIGITVTERSAAYALKAGSGYQLVDRHGVGFHQVSKVPKGLAAVTAKNADHNLRSGLADVAAALPDDLRSRLTRIEAPTRDQVTLILSGGVKVIWGSPADSDLKSQVAVVLLNVKDVRTVDVSAPSHPTTR